MVVDVNENAIIYEIHTHLLHEVINEVVTCLQTAIYGDGRLVENVL